MIDFIDLSMYSRRDLSNILQIAQQADNAGTPLPCLVVEQVVDAQYKMLHHPDKKRRNVNREHVSKCTLCGATDVPLYTLECGVGVCSACWEN